MRTLAGHAKKRAFFFFFFAACLRQVCLQMGFSRNDPWLYLSGDNPELLDVYPEMGYLRDIVYLLKAFMAPTSDALPEVCLASLYLNEL